MTDKLDMLVKELRHSDETSVLTGLEARVWQRIAKTQPSPSVLRVVLVLRALPVVLALGMGGAVGARAMTAHSELSAFSASPAYSVTRLVD